MSMKAKLRADLIGAGEGAFWLVITWLVTWGMMVHNDWLYLLAFGLSVLAGGVCFLHRRSAITMGRYRVRVGRTEMWWHLLVIPVLLALVIWTILESLFGGIDDARYKLVLLASLSTAGWVVYCLTNILKRVFQSFRNNRKRPA
ncbi:MULTISPECIES: hypothetical protein [Modicisalibacter]|uniref:hypothetical protein n=1 Tax=Modicisalibacter TaxID=574347 RepID=UPI0013968779|nr:MULTISPECIES: hypothetical protein [Halomonadaceae]MBZ9559130.1 hypothetical protein [Modicisalibacter sp. R2A 31.J]MBZ9576705.1 hypothetical protein [Modicisalibacter sp. MOD 31.J]